MGENNGIICGIVVFASEVHYDKLCTKKGRGKSANENDSKGPSFEYF